jgi:hypothetical protein
MSNAFDISAKSDRQIIDEANELAREFYRQEGYVVMDGFKFYESDHPRAIKAWNMAVIAYGHLTGTDLTHFQWGINDEPEQETEYRRFHGGDEFRPYSDRLIRPKKVAFEEGNSVLSFNSTGIKLANNGWISYAILFEEFAFVDRATGKTSLCGLPVHVG